MSRQEMELRSTYADLLEREDEPASLATVQALATGYSLAEPPPSLWRQVPRGVPGGAWVAPAPACGRVRMRVVQWTRYLAMVAVAVSVLVTATIQATGSSNVADLGTPTNDAPQYVPLEGFRHVRPPLPATRPPELVWIGTEDDLFSAAERWPLVKALDQFGTFSGLSASQTPDCFPEYPSTQYPCHAPTFDWSHASYHSRDIAFLHREVVNARGKPYERLSGAELTVFSRFLGSRRKSFAASVRAVLRASRGIQPLHGAQRQFPLLLIGDYVQTGTSTLAYGDLFANVGAPLSFDAVQTALQHYQVTGSGPALLVHDVNAEANVITALICHADHSQPRSVCSRGVIKQLLRYTK